MQRKLIWQSSLITLLVLFETSSGGAFQNIQIRRLHIVVTMAILFDKNENRICFIEAVAVFS